MSIFKRLFGMRKANKDTSDTKVDFEVKDLKKGFILDYDLKSWEVKDVSIYKWANGSADNEYTINGGDGDLFLNLTNSSGELSIYWQGDLMKIWPEFRAKARAGENVSNETFVYKNKKYYLASNGHAAVKSLKESFNMENWLFQSEDGSSFISFNKYEDDFVEAYEGKALSKHAVSNILPR